MAKVKPIPDGYPQVIPYLIVDDAKAAIDFYTKVLGGKERMQMPAPDGKIGHAEVEIGNGLIMLADEVPEMGQKSPKNVGGSPVTIAVYLDDVDSVFKKAIDAGAREVRAVEDQFYGDRSGGFEDPFGHFWSIQTHIEDVPPDEMEKRVAKAMAEGFGDH